MKVTYTGQVSSTRDRDGNTVNVKVYEVERTRVEKEIVNVAMLEAQKAELLQQVAEIDEKLSEIAKAEVK